MIGVKKKLMVIITQSPTVISPFLLLPLAMSVISVVGGLGSSNGDWRMGFDPNRFGPGVPSEAIHIRRRMNPRIGIKLIRTHHPEWSVSCKRRMVTASLGERQPTNTGCIGDHRRIFRLSADL